MVEERLSAESFRCTDAREMGDIELLSTPAKEMLKTVKITTRETAAEGSRGRNIRT